MAAQDASNSTGNCYYDYYFLYDKQNEDLVSPIKKDCIEKKLKICVEDDIRIGSSVTKSLGDVYRTCKRIVFFLTDELLNSKMLKLRMQANPHVQNLLLLYTDGNPLVPIWKADAQLIRDKIPVLYGRIPIYFDIGNDKIVTKLVALSEQPVYEETVKQVNDLVKSVIEVDRDDLSNISAPSESATDVNTKQSTNLYSNYGDGANQTIYKLNHPTIVSKHTDVKIKRILSYSSAPSASC